jgi:hypothetical protein
MTRWVSFGSQAICFEAPALVLLHLGYRMKECGQCHALTALTLARDLMLTVE